MPPNLVLATQRTSEASPNRWYLAYGSNLASGTFRERRGIRPLAQVNVLVPSLVLTFDLPGIPYWEPCFANVRRRQNEGGGPCGDKGNISRVPELNQEARELMGVVYLVTPQDFSRIIATEGGGQSYEEVEVECWRIPGSDWKEDEGDKRIIASTLLAPDNRRRSAPMQPSKRYIDIIRAGAREHDMPASYITYLDSIPYYHTSGLRQRVGAALFIAMWLPVILFILLLQLVFADRKTGRVPRWVGVVAKHGSSAMWNNYLQIWKKIFGSGEVTASRDASRWGLGKGDEGLTTEDEKRARDVPAAAHISLPLDIE